MQGKALLVLTTLVAACNPKPGGGARTDPSTPPVASIPVPTPAPATTATASEAIVTQTDPRALPQGWPWAMLRKSGRPVLPLELDMSSVDRSALRISDIRSFQVEAPRMWLLVLELAGSAAANKARPELLKELGREGRPYYPRAVANGRYLLIVGFPGEKPVSPEMEAAQTQYVQAFAGEE